MIGRLNHVGVATPSIDAAVAMYRDLFGATAIGAKFALPEQGVSVAFVDLPNSQIELIEPLGDASPIWGFLRRNPGGASTMSASKCPISWWRGTRCERAARPCSGPASRGSGRTGYR